MDYTLFSRFGIQGSGLKYNAYALWANWTDVTNWVCSYIPVTSVLIYDCIPEVGGGVSIIAFNTKLNDQKFS